jgi:hypothetical protein
MDWKESMRRNLEGPIHAAILAYLRRQYPKAVIHLTLLSVSLPCDTWKTKFNPNPENLCRAHSACGGF